MIKHLSKHGNSMALVIERPVLELLGATAETPFEIETNGRSLLLTPVLPKKRATRFQNAMNKIGRQYAESFRELAK